MYLIVGVVVVIVIIAAAVLLMGGSEDKKTTIPAGIAENISDMMGPGPVMPGSDRDEHGCIPSAGYSWCEGLGECIRTWETYCPGESPVESAMEAMCDDTDVGAVYKCGDFYRVVSMMPGAGSTIYMANGTRLQCPLVAPDSMSEDCRMYIMGSNCIETDLCTGEMVVPGSADVMVGNDSDEHGCKASAGYTWCPITDKCIRPWEEACGDAECLGMSASDAMQIAMASDCESSTNGTLTAVALCNNITRTFQIKMDSPKENCGLGCYVYVDNSTAVANWMCTGLLM